MPLRRPEGAVPATLWRRRAILFIRAAGWLSLLPDRPEWHPLVATPFFPSVSIPLEKIKTAKAGGILIGPDLRVDTADGTLRFTVWPRELVRRWLTAAGIAVE